MNCPATDRGPSGWLGSTMVTLPGEAGSELQGHQSSRDHYGPSVLGFLQIPQASLDPRPVPPLQDTGVASYPSCVTVTVSSQLNVLCAAPFHRVIFSGVTSIRKSI